MKSCGKSHLLAVGLDRADAGVRHEEVGAEGGEEGRDVRDQLLDASDAAMATVAIEPVPLLGRCLPTSISEHPPERPGHFTHFGSFCNFEDEKLFCEKGKA